MTVKDLIQKLQKYPPNMEVVGQNDDGRYPTDISLFSANILNNKWSEKVKDSIEVVVIETTY